MAIERYIIGKHDSGHHEGKRSEIRRIMCCEDQIKLYQQGDDPVPPIISTMREKVGEEIISQNGCAFRIREYYKGWKASIPGGIPVQGITGEETMREITVIRPPHIVDVKDKRT